MHDSESAPPVRGHRPVPRKFRARGCNFVGGVRLDCPMTYSRFVPALALAASFALAGCKSDAEKVCGHLADLAEKAAKDDPGSEKFLKKFEDREGCVADVEKMQKEDAKAFDAAKDCILEADKLEGAVGCMFKAAAASKSAE
jgi:hypothetical protein